MKVNEKGIALIKHFESLHDGDLSKIGCQPKMDPVGIWTVGYGHAMWNAAQNRWFRGPGDKEAVYAVYPNLSENAANLLLLTDLLQYEAAVLKMIKRRDLSDDEFSAAVSFCYNCGTHYKNKIGIRTPYKIWWHIDNRTTGGTMYNYWKESVITAGGKVLPGLVRRRKAEAVLYISGLLDFNPAM